MSSSAAALSTRPLSASANRGTGRQWKDFQSSDEDHRRASVPGYAVRIQALPPVRQKRSSDPPPSIGSISTSRRSRSPSSSGSPSQRSRFAGTTSRAHGSRSDETPRACSPIRSGSESSSATLPSQKPPGSCLLLRGKPCHEERQNEPHRRDCGGGRSRQGCDIASRPDAPPPPAPDPGSRYSPSAAPPPVRRPLRASSGQELRRAGKLRPSAATSNSIVEALRNNWNRSVPGSNGSNATKAVTVPAPAPRAFDNRTSHQSRQAVPPGNNGDKQDLGEINWPDVAEIASTLQLPDHDPSSANGIRHSTFP